MERLLLVLEAAAKADPDGAAARLTAQMPPTVYLVNRGEAAEAAALGLARNLRQAGVAVELDGSGAAFGKQFKRADRCGAPWALVIGDQEAEQGCVRLCCCAPKSTSRPWRLMPSLHWWRPWGNPFRNCR